MESNVVIKTQKVNVDGNGINYTESHLEGVNPEKTLLLLPGSLGEFFLMKLNVNSLKFIFQGSGPTDFYHQIVNLPKILPNYRIIAWDPPGLGEKLFS